MTGPSHLSNYEAAIWWMNTADQIINDTGGEEPPAAAVASHAALIRASVYSSLAIADAITSQDTLNRPADKPTGACPAAIETPYSDTITATDPCIYANGHTGAHRDEHGRTWHTEPIRVPRCQHHSTDGRQCTLTLEHPGICTDWNGHHIP